MRRYFLGLGTNLGDRAHNLAAAATAIATFARVTRASRCYQTAPLGFTGQPRFLNQVLEVQSELEPFQLLHALKGVERALGRTETFRNGPRIIDIDILLADDVVLDAPALHIPHPRLAQRAFVLRPLAELVDHVLDTPISALLERVADQDAEPLDA